MMIVLGDLKCFQRYGEDVYALPPGCEGIPYGNWDYCYDASSLIPIFKPFGDIFDGHYYSDYYVYIIYVLIAMVVGLLLMNICWLHRCQKQKMDGKYKTVQ
eukprot:1719_1